MANILPDKSNMADILKEKNNMTETITGIFVEKSMTFSLANDNRVYFIKIEPAGPREQLSENAESREQLILVPSIKVKRFRMCPML